MCGAKTDVRFGPKADIQEFGSRRKQSPRTLPGALLWTFVFQSTRLELCPISVRWLVVVAWTTVVVAASTIIVGATTVVVCVRPKRRLCICVCAALVSGWGNNVAAADIEIERLGERWHCHQTQ